MSTTADLVKAIRHKNHSLKFYVRQL